MKNEFHLRPARRTDLTEITELIRATDLVESGESNFTQEDLEEEWGKPRFDLAQDAWVAVVADHKAQGKRIVGYEELWNRAGHALLAGDGYVHPEYLDLGIGTALLNQVEARAQEHCALAENDLQVSVRNGVYGSDQRARRLHENEGYHVLRYFWRMRIDLESSPLLPDWPQGINLRTMRPGKDELEIYTANIESFSDHWEYLPPRYEDWLARTVKREDFDPSLCFLAEAGGVLTGFCLCRSRPEGGWVSTLGVRRPWRRQGIGLALLLHSFGEFYRRNQHRIELGVDAASLTGATRLYERAGMQMVHEYVIYEKIIRKGKPVVSTDE